MAHITRYNLLCIIYVTLGAFFYAYDSGCTTSVLGYPAFLDYFEFDTNTLGALGSSYYGDNLLGNLVTTWLADHLGRLRIIQIASAIALVGTTLQTAAVNQGMLFSGRIVGGFACGIVLSVCPPYASEISTPEIRGRVGGLYR
jgi:MFS family permease